ncbi:hypothetical protein [uncultured Herbaspirillum sp.]|uniref:hypothetical protein n=1 Tax=uncultured Herbaspirillum sp. TaxID=160236 RepID=UPI00260BCC1C|nr:hypothetical protein [uncultured Herbaspirillum sp.]
MSDKRLRFVRKLTCVKPWRPAGWLEWGREGNAVEKTGEAMGVQEQSSSISHEMKIRIGGTTYLIESRASGGPDEHRLYAYRVWCDGELVKDWTEGNMADFFGKLSPAHVQ